MRKNEDRMQSIFCTKLVANEVKDICLKMHSNEVKGSLENKQIIIIKKKFNANKNSISTQIFRRAREDTELAGLQDRETKGKFST